MTEAQAKYRNDLINRLSDNLLRHYDQMDILRAFLAANLPEPTDTRDASAQISALKGDIRKYKPEHAQALLDQLGNSGWANLVAKVKAITSIDHQADLAKLGNRVELTRQELREVFNA